MFRVVDSEDIKKAAFMFIGSTIIKSKVNLIFVCASGI